MGKKKGGKGAEKKNGEGNGVWLTSPDVRENAEWEAYYLQQKIVPDEEWPMFLECLRTDLPTAFRVVTCTPHQHYIRAYIHQTMEQLKRDEAAGALPEACPSSFDPPSSRSDIASSGETNVPASTSCWRREAKLSQAFRAISWFLQGSEAFQIDVSRAALRSCKPLLAFHRFLVAQSEAATIMRQEVVSMIPALFFDIKADSCVLDLCAAPGSKTSQLLERMHVVHKKEREQARLNSLRGQENGVSSVRRGSLDSEISALVPPGLVVANDADSGRAHMLIHHLRHIHSPCLLVTSHSAQFFPAILVPSATPPESPVSTVSAVSSNSPERAACPSPPGLEDRGGAVCPSAFLRPHLRPLLFDCVLCDVPCSADGTLRKARSLWTRWHSNQGLGCHRLQLQILLRGIKLCKVNGRIVYSTCSFNPVENEAVVAAALEKTKGAVELVDCSGVLPTLQRRPGLKTWRVYWQKEFYDRFEDVPQTSAARQKVRPTMFPQYAASKAGEGKNGQDGLPLHRCMRFLPHLNNTGGFFVAVLEKKRHVPFHVKSRAADADTETPEGADVDGNLPEGDDEEEEEERENDDQEAEMKPAAGSGNGPEKSLNMGIQGSRNVGGSTTSRNCEAPRTLDQLQLDFVSLGWPQSFVEKQQHQYRRKVQQTRAAEAARATYAESAASAEKATQECPVSEAVGREEGENEGSCIHEEKLKAAWRAACASMGVPKECAVEAEAPMRSHEDSGAEGGMNGEQRRLRLLQELRACLFVRRRGEGENISMARKKPKHENAGTSRGTPAVCEVETGNAMEHTGVADIVKDEKLLRTVWFVSHGVERALSGVGRSRYKVVSAGCVAFQCRNSSKYRLSYGGAQWLVPFVDVSDCGEAEAERNCGNTGAVCLHRGGSTGKPDQTWDGKQPCFGTQGQGTKEGHVVLRISNELMMALLGAEGAPPRVDMSTLKHLQGGAELRQSTEEGPLVLVTTVLSEKVVEESDVSSQEKGSGFDKTGVAAFSGSGEAHGEPAKPTTLIAPAWRGRSNIEIMVDAHTCHALRCLLSHRNSLVSASARHRGSAQEIDTNGI
ncbi:putative tRNA (cytosine(34)-C(5))-methyltransferase [Toxoplasma gondii GAB2-2007-GAL-DOM2]|uniref:Putative tRNA (Cytosine(34)-C(5))-methyltransferase n=7 Tax=Toxoplasma gondii TaxID=5811 RepID=S7V2F4_TOXGG|nr:putative tRNA (cytosine(34)-C(5))-methyltransferase [Toxoplasma gondii GT1]KAF4641559.1 putative tRNA (cytosine(34)-C(5))-methyltransferase [Toxoplasma gondii]KFG30063.1 putative tRNA (cytosine(34)-C(5))-methyltransferase [Toxoplasma gondii GAB2-2007-GAL-DOM2]RQX68166.1 putative tRNA (cytosine(34)-C(5))-methyltransferase [Toxoplasma gondii CAST]